MPRDGGSRLDGGEERLDGGDGEPALCPPGAFLCDSFEGESIDPSRWVTASDEPFFAIDTTTAVDGASSLRLRFGARYGVDSNGAFLTSANPLSAPDDRIWSRFYVRLTSLSDAHPYYSAAADRGDPFFPYPTMLGFGVIRGEPMLGAWVYDEDDPQRAGGLDSAQIWGQGSTIQPGVWFCVEMMMFGDDQGPGDTDHDAEEVRVWIDGVEIDQLHATDARWYDPPEHWSPHYDGGYWRLGFSSISADEEELWIDAFALSHERIGCL